MSRPRVGAFLNHGAEMHTQSKILVVLVLVCILGYSWLSRGSRPPARSLNPTQTIPAGASVPVYGFYNDGERPALVTVKGKACSARVTGDCWGPDGKPGSPNGTQGSASLMRVDRHGAEIPFATPGRYRALVACLQPNCSDAIRSQRMAVGSEFIVCGSYRVYFWSNALREIGRPYPAGNFALATGEFRFAYTPGDPQAVQRCAANPHAWFIPLS
jgi:hypothetical protein